MQVFNVEGMSCGHCVKAITQAVQAKDPAADVQIDLGAKTCLLYTSPSPRDGLLSRMPSSA